MIPDGAVLRATLTEGRPIVMSSAVPLARLIMSLSLPVAFEYSRCLVSRGMLKQSTPCPQTRRNSYRSSTGEEGLQKYSSLRSTG